MSFALPDASVNKNLEGHGFRATVQKFGGFLAGMIMPNIGAFIAWGLLTAFVIPTGWTPNADLAKMVDPIITYLLPLLIGYTGGRTVHGQRGAVIGAIATMGVIVGSSVPMFLGAMIMGPLSAWILKRFDKLIQDHIPTGFEMLIDNFSLGILGMLLAIAGRLLIEPVVTTLVGWMAAGVSILVANHLLPLASILVEPAKVLFLNNAVNHGILTPLGIEQAKSAGSSILFMVESNPGPGFGLLLAYWVAGPRVVRGSVPGAIIIHLFGGIHEIFFPYVLMKPKLIAATILGGMSGVFTGTLLGAGLVAPASPGSIIAWMAVTPRGKYLANLADFAVATAVAFIVAFLLLKAERKEPEALEEEAAEPLQGEAATVAARAVAAAGPTISGKDVRQVVIACDAGMGSSVMVASAMKKQLSPYGVTVIHTPVNEIPADAQVVLTQEGLAERARRQVPNAAIVPFTVYMGDPAFAKVEQAIRAGSPIGPDLLTGPAPAAAASATTAPAATAPATTAPTGAAAAAAGATAGTATRPRRRKKLPADVLPREAIRLGLPTRSKDEVIRLCGDILVGIGATDPAYTDAMFARELQVATYMGNGFAIPHGTNEARAHVKRTALGFLQFPEGVEWEGHTVYVAIPIASNSDEHVGILGALAGVLADPASAEKLRKATSPDEVMELLAPEEGE